jgi:putative DNA primase/helicase
LNSYKIQARYNLISKREEIILPGEGGCSDNSANSNCSQIVSLAALNGINSQHVLAYVHVIADRNLYNPAKNWIESKPWDRRDRLEDFYDTLTEREGYPLDLKKVLMRKWLLSAVAAVLNSNQFHSRGVLTLQGPQSIGKTSWLRSSVGGGPAGGTENLIKVDHHIDGHNKDTLLTAIGHWIVEIGELDSSFKKDIAKLKGFLTATEDKIRRPYDKADSVYPRRTVFCASVNDANFLVDPTGNSRWWTIPVVGVKFNHDVDMQQLFAQLAIEYHDGGEWWLSPEEDKLLATQNEKHCAINAIHARLAEVIDFDSIGAAGLPAFGAMELLRKIGVLNPTNTQSKDCANFLRQHCGESSRIKGYDKWRVPLLQNELLQAIRTTPKDAFHGRNPDDF